MSTQPNKPNDLAWARNATREAITRAVRALESQIKIERKQLDDEYALLAAAKQRLGIS